MQSPTPQAPPRFRLDLNAYQLLDGERPVRLERQPMELLILLVEHRGELLTRDDISARLWGKNVFVDSDRNINSIVRKLRHAFSDDPDQPVYLETVVVKGYRFVGPLEVISKPARTGSPRIPATTPEPSRTKRVWIIGLSGWVVLAVVIWLGLHSRTPSPPVEPQARSVAVLPLENLSGDPSQEYFADGMTQELTSELAQAPELHVIAHTSVLQYKSGKKSVREIAKELDVDTVIEGSVQRSGDRVRVSVQLIRSDSDRAMWANTYERDLRDILTLQSDIADDIAEQVKIRLKTAHAQTRGPTVLDPQAHDDYLQGIYHYEKNTEGDLQESVDDFRRAISRAPNYAAAYAGMANTYLELGVFYWPPRRAMPQAESAALKALELDPNLSDAHAALGSVYYYYDWDWTAAEREAKRALALSPSNAYAHDLLGSYYATVGRADDSMLELQRASRLAPRSAEILGDTVFWAFFSRKYDLAIANGNDAILKEPENAFAQVFLGMAYAEKGKSADALKHADLAQRYDKGPLVASFRANVYALAGRTTEALSQLRVIQQQRVEHYSCAYELGTAYILLNHVGSGFEWLQNAYNGRSECMILLKVDPRLDGVRSDKRYEQLLKKVGLSN